MGLGYLYSFAVQENDLLQKFPLLCELNHGSESLTWLFLTYYTDE